MQCNSLNKQAKVRRTEAQWQDIMLTFDESGLTQEAFCIQQSLATATDMRRSFDGLSAQVKQLLNENPQSGALFVFINRRRTQLKCLYFESGGYNLESHTYSRLFLLVLFNFSGNFIDGYKRC